MFENYFIYLFFWGGFRLPGHLLLLNSSPSLFLGM